MAEEYNNPGVRHAALARPLPVNIFFSLSLFLVSLHFGYIWPAKRISVCLRRALDLREVSKYDRFPVHEE